MVRLKIDGRLDGRHGGTMTVDRERGLVAVRPHGRRREYRLPLAFVAEMVIAKVVKQELGRVR